jgi:hypothetical protein
MAVEVITYRLGPGRSGKSTHQLTVVVVPLLSLEPRRRQLSPIRVLATLIPMFTVFGDPPVQKLQLSRTAFRPHNLLFYNTNLSTSNPCNSTDFSPHVLANCQHVSFTMLSKSSHVATVVASIGFLTVGTLSLLRLQSYHQWNEGFECSLPQHTKLCQNRPARFNQTWIELGPSNET